MRYPFAHLLLMCVYAILAGYSAAMEIAFYVELNFEYFRELLKIEKIPSHDTFSRVLRYTEKPMKRFLMANEHDPNRIEKLLFKNIAQEET